MKKKFVNHESKVRLDKFLVSILSEEFNYSRAYIQKMIDQDLVKVNDQKQNANYNLKVDDVVEVEIIPVVEPTFAAENISFNIVYEDNDLVVIDKPNNLVVHPAIGNPNGTLVNGLMYHFENNLSDLGGQLRPGIVHRLDKQTTGLMIIAKNNQTHQLLSEMFSRHEIEKTYLAIVNGVIEEDEAIIDAPIGRSDNDRKKMEVTAKNSKKAVTKFKVLERFKNATLVKVKLETGRTHQIRVHFKYINHPVLNDPVYGLSKEVVDDYGQYLHSYQLEFIHPITHEKIILESNIPDEFNDKIIRLRNVV